MYVACCAVTKTSKKSNCIDKFNQVSVVKVVGSLDQIRLHCCCDSNCSSSWKPETMTRQCFLWVTQVLLEHFKTTGTSECVFDTKTQNVKELTGKYSSVCSSLPLTQCCDDFVSATPSNHRTKVFCLFLCVCCYNHVIWSYKVYNFLPPGGEKVYL